MTDADIVWFLSKPVKYTSAITPIFLRFGLLLSALGAYRDKDVCGLCLGKKHQSSVATATHCRGIFHRHYILKTKLYQLVINRISVKDIPVFIFFMSVFTFNIFLFQFIPT